jgi:hypothetical protein
VKERVKRQKRQNEEGIIEKEQGGVVRPTRRQAHFTSVHSKVAIYNTQTITTNNTKKQKGVD